MFVGTLEERKNIRDIILAQNKREFVRAIEDAFVKETSDIENRQIDLALKNSWD